MHNHNDTTGAASMSATACKAEGASEVPMIFSQLFHFLAAFAISLASHHTLAVATLACQ